MSEVLEPFDFVIQRKNIAKKPWKFGARKFFHCFHCFKPNANMVVNMDSLGLVARK